jgi:acyl dehydratase
MWHRHRCDAGDETANVTGLYLDDFEVGRVFEHAIRRTVTEMDNTLFSCLTHNPQPLHIDHDFASKSEWGKPLVNSLFTLGLMIGISVNDTTLGTTVANLGMTDVRFPRPVFHGDTIHVTTEVLSRRETRSRPDAGIVELLHKAFNQRGEVVAECRRQAMMRKRPQT